MPHEVNIRYAPPKRIAICKVKDHYNNFIKHYSEMNFRFDTTDLREMMGVNPKRFASIISGEELTLSEYIGYCEYFKLPLNELCTYNYGNGPKRTFKIPSFPNHKLNRKAA